MVLFWAMGTWTSGSSVLLLAKLAFVTSLVTSVVTSCGEDRSFPDGPAVDAAAPTGTFTASWTIADGSAPLSCDDVGATSVVVGTRLATSGSGSNQVFSCNSAQGTSQALPPGDYVLTPSLRAPTGTLATAPATEITIRSGENVTVSPWQFSVQATGQFSINLTAGATSNCGTPGSQISAMTMTLSRSGSCQPVVFNIPAGATQPAGTYTRDCVTSAAYGCIERDQRAVSSTLPSGEYALTISANEGATPCWTGTRTIRVPTGGGARHFDVSLTELSSPGC